MGWIELLTYFEAASTTSLDVSDEYAQAPIGSLKNHKFLPLTQMSVEYKTYQQKQQLVATTSCNI